jgi:hypothetical protein
VVYRISKACFEELYREKEASILGTSIISFIDIVKEEEEEEEPPRKKQKRNRGTHTYWKCSKCLQPICKGQKEGKSCWELAHRQLDL